MIVKTDERERNGAENCIVPCERSESNTYYGTPAVFRNVQRKFVSFSYECIF